MPFYSTSQHKELHELANLDHEIAAIAGAQSLLHWDQEVNMPAKGVTLRSTQISTLAGILHEKQTDQKIADLLTKLEQKMEKNPDSFTLEEQSYLRVMRKNYDKETKLPKKLVQELSEATSTGLQSWNQARNEDNFSLFEKDLEKIVDLTIKKAEFLSGGNNLYDSLLDEYEEGATTSWIESVFKPLKQSTQKLLKEISADGISISTDILHGTFPWHDQEQFIFDVIQWMGYDLEAGRQDLSTHPFTIDFGGPQDVRITTRVDQDLIHYALIPSIHETGHAVYEQNVNPEYTQTSLYGGTSLGIHESQSRFFENRVGKSLSFWKHWYPKLHSIFPDQLPKDGLIDFYRALNKVENSLIRVEADELTYNLHIILRFEIEKDLIAGKIKVKDLPQLWNEKMKDYLGLQPETDKVGVLQDIHWAHGAFGYFPTYTLGNLYAAQITNTMLKKQPLNEMLENGDFSQVFEWLRTNIHTHGQVHPPRELLTQVTGEDLTPSYFTDYLESKYRELYKLV